MSIEEMDYEIKILSKNTGEQLSEIAYIINAAILMILISTVFKIYTMKLLTFERN